MEKNKKTKKKTKGGQKLTASSLLNKLSSLASPSSASTPKNSTPSTPVTSPRREPTITRHPGKEHQVSVSLPPSPRHFHSEPYPRHVHSHQQYHTGETSPILTPRHANSAPPSPRAVESLLPYHPCNTTPQRKVASRTAETRRQQAQQPQQLTLSQPNWPPIPNPNDHLSARGHSKSAGQIQKLAQNVDAGLECLRNEARIEIVPSHCCACTCGAHQQHQQQQQQQLSPRRKISRPTEITYTTQTPKLEIPAKKAVSFDTPKVVTSPKSSLLNEPAASKMLLKTTSNRQLLRLFDYNRNMDDRDEEETTTTTTTTTGESSNTTERESGTSESTRSSTESSESELSASLDESLTLELSEIKELYRALDYHSDEADRIIVNEFKSAPPSMGTLKKKASIHILSPRTLEVQQRWTYKKYENGIVNFTRTDIKLETWRFCYVCDTRVAQMRYIRHLALTEVRENFADFRCCNVYRIIKFCEHCFRQYNEKQAENPTTPQLVKLSEKAMTVFCSL